METIKECADHFSKEDTDVIIYIGGIDRKGYENFCATISTTKKQKLLLVLYTFGGDPSAGYRIARAAIHHYGCDNFSILIPSFCKSAGTLICIGAKTLIMCDQAELGPLDVQFRKQDEIFQQGSGLDILRGITYLQTEALQSFKSYLLDINGGSGLSTKIASEISSKLVIGLYEPLLAQIDPVKLGEMNAALQIANAYGTRLNDKSQSLKPNALAQLISDYPTHGFVIDRAEARQLFVSVLSPEKHHLDLADFTLKSIMKLTRQDNAFVLDFVETFKTRPNENPDEQSKTTASDNTTETSGAATTEFPAEGLDEIHTRDNEPQ